MTTSAALGVALLVGEDTADRAGLRRALEAAGFQTIGCGSASAAPLPIDAQRVDLVLLDSRQPDTGTLDLIGQIRASAGAARRDTAIILISPCRVDSNFREQALDLGADVCLCDCISDAELLATTRAVARRLEQMKKARQDERLLDALFEYIPEGITVADAPDVTIRRVSRFGTEILGRTREELESLPASEHPTQWGVFRADGVTPARAEDLPLTRAASGGAVITDEEWVLRRPDGAQITVLCNAGPIHDEAGRVTGGVIAWRDITSRKHVEQALQARTEELNKADQAKNEFLATVVHELRQPINAALAAVHVMKARPSAQGGVRARDVLERQLYTMARLVEDLLDTSRIVRRQVTLDVQPHDLNLIVQRAMETVFAAAEERGVRLSGRVPLTPTHVRADASRLEQVFVNLLTNAVRHTPPDGDVDVSLETTPHGATIRVRDTGQGIHVDRLARVFDLFARGENSRGLGIGLAVARGLVEAHGGTVEARSDGSGKGSEFIVTLPLPRSTSAGG